MCNQRIRSVLYNMGDNVRPEIRYAIGQGSIHNRMTNLFNPRGQILEMSPSHINGNRRRSLQFSC